MSNKRVLTVLPGFHGPFFPRTLEVFHEQVYGDAGFNYCGNELEKAFEGAAGFVGITRKKTNDGYTWFWALEFTAGAIKILVLLPWSQDFDRTEGTTSDRHTAIYTNSSVSPEFLDEFLRKQIFPHWNRKFGTSLA